MLRLRKQKSASPETPILQPNAAGVDVGANEIYIAVPADRDSQAVRRFRTFTGDLKAAADWLKRCGIESVAMESTSVYWIPFFQILEESGFTVFLVNARHVKNVPGRKSDVADCHRTSQIVNGCNTCTRWDCYAPSSGPSRRYALYVRFCDIAKAWCRSQARMCSTCKRRLIK